MRWGMAVARSSKHDRDSDSDIVTAVRLALPDVRAVTLFGSRAEGTDTSDSDLDLAILLPHRADPVRLWEAGEAIARRPLF